MLPVVAGAVTVHVTSALGGVWTQPPLVYVLPQVIVGLAGVACAVLITVDVDQPPLDRPSSSATDARTYRVLLSGRSASGVHDRVEPEAPSGVVHFATNVVAVAVAEVWT